MNVYAAQFDLAWEDKPANHAKAHALLEQAAPAPDSLVVLPEMFATGFSMNAAVTSDSATRATQNFLAEQARRWQCYVLAGVVNDGRQDGHTGKGRNEAITYAPDGHEHARYAKLHPFTLGGEAANYEAGESLMLFDWQGFTVAPFICYDLRFPEIFRVAAQRGANLFVVIASWPARRAEHWLALAKARAIENQAYVIAVNRCGADPGHTYSGQTQIIEFSGAVLAAAQDKETVLHATLDLTALQEYRRALPFLQDIRADFLPAAQQRAQASR